MGYNDVTEEKSWLTVTELSKKLRIPDATLRRYIRYHGCHLKFRKRHKSYLIANDSVDVLIKIREAYSSGNSIEGVEDMLSVCMTPTIITITDDNSGDHVGINVVESLTELRKIMTKQNEIIQSLGQIMKEQINSQREERVTDCLTKWRIERKLEQKALKLWADKSKFERMRRVGLFWFKENVEARECFVRKYIDEHYEKLLLQEYELSELF